MAARPTNGGTLLPVLQLLIIAVVVLATLGSVTYLAAVGRIDSEATTALIGAIAGSGGTAGAIAAIQSNGRRRANGPAANASQVTPSELPRG